MSIVCASARQHLNLLRVSLSLLIFVHLLPLNSSTPLASKIYSAVASSIPLSSSSSSSLPSHLWGEYQKALHEGMDVDSLRMFYPKDLLETNSGLVLSYNLSLSAQEEVEEEMVEAELTLSLTHNHTQQRLRLYAIDQHSGRVLRLLDAKVVRVDESGRGWCTLDILDHLRRQGSMVSFLAVLPDGVELLVSPSNRVSSIGGERRAAATITVRYMKREDEEDGREVRRKRSTSAEEKRRLKKLKKKGRRDRVGGERGLCQRSSMYVDFKELNWSDWILAPQGYDAYKCVGRCVHPSPAKQNSSNHAIIQGLLHSIDPQIPPPCCVPTEMAPLAILYIDTDNKVTMKEYPDMIVTACGCR